MCRNIAGCIVATVLSLVCFSCASNETSVFHNDRDQQSQLILSLQQIDKWTNKESVWFHLSGPYYALKLLRLASSSSSSSNTKHNANISKGLSGSSLSSFTENVIFSPLALKLSLVAIASLGNASQENWINQFLLDEPIDFSTQSSLQQEFLSSPDRLPETEHNPLVQHHSDERTKPCLYLPTLPYSFFGLLAPHEQGRSSRASNVKTGSGAVGSKIGKETSFQLQRYQKIKLCHSFEINDTEECLTSFIGDLDDFCDHNITRDYIEYHHLKETFTNAQMARHLLRHFDEQQSEDDIPSLGHHCYIRRVLFRSKQPAFNLTFSNQSHALFKRALRWFRMKQFSLASLPGSNSSNVSSITENDEALRLFEREYLSSNQASVPLSAALPPNTSSNTLLSVILFDQKLKQSFNRLDGRWNFYDSKGKVHQVVTLAKHDRFGVIIHRDEPANHSHTVLRIPYENDKYSLLILLPDERSSIERMLSNLSDKHLDFYLKRFYAEEDQLKIVLTIPRFSSIGQYDFAPLLKREGLVEEHFHLSRVHSNFTVSPSIRQFIKVLNYGFEDTETKLSLEPRAADDERAADASINDFVSVNRPFVYLIVGKYIDLHRKPAFEVLVSGIVRRPS